MSDNEIHSPAYPSKGLLPRNILKRNKVSHTAVGRAVAGVSRTKNAIKIVIKNSIRGVGGWEGGR